MKHRQTNGWTFAVESPFNPALDKDERARPLDFVLTPGERDVALMGSLHIERRRRELNRLDTAQAMADELARRDEQCK